MAFVSFYLAQRVLDVTLRPDTPEFWLTMQIVMLRGFTTAYPAN